mgnify:CR=1 FL=1
MRRIIDWWECCVTALEKRLRTDVRYLLSGTFWLTTGQVASSLAVFAMGLAFANLLPKETYGTYKYLLSLAGLLSIFTLPGIAAALTRAVARGYQGSFAEATRTRIRYGFLGCAAGMCVAAYYAIAGNMTLAGGLVVISLFLPVFDTFGLYNSYLQGRQQFRVYVHLGLIMQIGSVALIIIATIMTRSLFVILITYFASYASLRYLAWRYVRKRFHPEGNTDPELISYGKHMTVMNLLSQLAGQADSILIFHFLGPTDLALYAVAVAGPDQIKNITGSVSDLLFPRLASQPEADVRRTILSKALLLVCAMAVIIAAYVLIAPFLYRLFFPHYHDSIFLSQLFALSMVNAFFSPFAVFLQAHGKVRELYAANAGSSLFQVAAMTVGVLWFGLIGLVAARIAARIVGGALNLLFFYVPLTKPA